MSAVSTPATDSPPYDLIDEVDVAGLKVAVVRAALELDVFTAVQGGADSVAALAVATGSSERGTAVLVRALLSLELLQRVDGGLRCSPTSSTYLAAGGEGCATAILLTWFRNRDHLVDALRSGKGPGDHAVDEAVDDWHAYASPDLVRWSDKAAVVTAQLASIGLAVPAGARVLDLGCGSGIIGFTLIRDVAGATLVAVDRAGVLPVAERLAAAMGVHDRVSFIGADVATAEIPEDTFDVALLINVAQYLDDERLLDTLSTAQRSLRPGGRLMVTTPVVDDGAPGNAVNWTTAIEMFLASGIDQRSEQQILALMSDAGLQRPTRVSPSGFIGEVSSEVRVGSR